LGIERKAKSKRGEYGKREYAGKRENRMAIMIREHNKDYIEN